MIKLASILQEIGDATSPVPYTKTSEKESAYVSDMDRTLPSSSNQPKGSTGMQIMFGLKTDKYSGPVGDTARTNRGVQYKVMSTVTKILKDYIEEHPELARIDYEPVKKNAEDQGRMKLYRAYVTKALPNWNYREDDYGWVRVEKPPQEKKKTGFFKSLFK